jgi:hypothetical protein
LLRRKPVVRLVFPENIKDRQRMSSFFDITHVHFAQHLSVF